MTTSRTDFAAIRNTVSDGVIHRRELNARGVSNSMIAKRCAPNGPWQRLLPGVILMHPGAPNRRQLLRAALAYAGEGAVLTGLDALAAHGVPVRPSGPVRVLLPAGRRLAASGFVDFERTTRPHGRAHPDGLRYAPPARAALDLARRERDGVRLRRLLSLPVCHGLCTVTQLRTELSAGSQRGSAAPRAALQALSQGVEPAALALARRLVARTPVPAPSWDVRLYGRHGRSLAEVDAWWDEVGLAWLITAELPEANQDLVSLRAGGIVTVTTSPARLHGDPEGVVRELARAFMMAAKRGRPQVRAEPLDQRQHCDTA